MPIKAKFVITDYQFPTIDAEHDVIERSNGELSAFQCRTEEDVIAAAGQADVLLVQWAPITREVLKHLPKCKVIVRYGIGLDNIDMDAARERGIIVRNIPDYCTEEVADHTLALSLCLARQIPMIDARVRDGIWSIVSSRPMLASRQSNFVTIGYGRIARAVLNRARAFKFRLATCDPFLPDHVELPEDVTKVELNEALEMADILSLNLPLSSNTKHMIGAQAFVRMKKSAVLINTARGALVDTMELALALQDGRIAAAGIDVFEAEPLPLDHPLRRCPNVVLTSHLSWYSELSGPTLQRMTAEEAVRTYDKASAEQCT